MSIDLNKIELPVRDVMSEKIVSIDFKSNAQCIAQKMSKHNINNIVIKKNDVVVGIITEKDLVQKILAKDIKPSTVCAENIMSAPIISIKSSENVIIAAQKMIKSNIRRLVVMENNSIIGIVTDKDILALSPDLNFILKNLIAINSEEYFPKNSEIESGICEQCSVFSNDLSIIGGNILCESCRDERGDFD
ncbi:MAG: CBS domain-containing protein [Methanosarcinaceae archaeon]|jgi:signal-transduction protein with cAMP-binding, CBS, and nucleotidyltransferase domain|nr:CBS domain-containing protein [Methanosarcinaceae archaeon]NKQ38986.1 CBS domain-containing protein [Methanosarcinales archaeon]